MPTQRIANLGGLGLNTDVLPSLLPENAVTISDNVVCEDGGLQSVIGETEIIPSLAIKPIYHQAYTDFSGNQWIIISDGAGVHAYDIGGGGLEITPTDDDTVGGVKEPWSGGFVSFTVLNGVLVVNSASEGLFYWGETDAPLLVSPGWDATWRCQQIASLRYNLVALNMTEDGAVFPHKTRWSHFAQDGAIPTDWTPTTANEAGDDVLGETAGAIVGGVNVRNSLMIIKEDAVYSMDWIGNPYVFQTTRLEGGVGTRTPRGFCEMRGALVVASSTDIIAFDGQNSQSLVDARVRDGLFTDISEEYWDFLQVYFHSPSSRLFVGVPTRGDTGSLSYAYVFNMEENTWGKKRLRRIYGFETAFISLTTGQPTWDELDAPAAVRSAPEIAWIEGVNWNGQIDGSWNKGVYQPSVPDVILLESNDTDTIWNVVAAAVASTDSDGTPKSCKARRDGIPIEGAHGLAMLTYVFPELKGDLRDQNGVNIPLIMRFGGQEQPSDAVTWDPAYYEVWPGKTSIIDPRVTGRFLSWQLESNGIGQWHLGALTFEWEHAGAL